MDIEQLILDLIKHDSIDVNVDCQAAANSLLIALKVGVLHAACSPAAEWGLHTEQCDLELSAMEFARRPSAGAFKLCIR